jgi:hypothetical protein
MMELYLAKFSEGNEILVLKSLAYFADADKEVGPILLRRDVTWEAVKAGIIRSLKEYTSV